MRRHGAATTCFLLVAVTGCGAPSVQRDYGVRPYNTDIELGTKATPAPIPTAHRALEPPGFPAPVALPPSISALRPGDAAAIAVPSSAPAVGCPKARVNDYPKEEATQLVTAPPIAGTYTYRQTGTMTSGNTTTIAPTSFAREISAVSTTKDATGSDRIGWTAIDAFPGGTSIQTTYEAVSGTPESTSDGIYLTSQSEVDSAGTVTGTFRPATPVLLMQLPAEGLTSGSGWDSAGTDPISGVGMYVHGVVSGRQRVDACGTVIDAWKVQLTGSVLRTSSNSDDFTVTYDVATQLGGLFVGADSTLTRGEELTVHVKQLINADRPQSAASP